MSKIIYKFSDGSVSEIEVSDELYALHLQLLQEEKRNFWKETRRHISLNYLNELGVDFEDSHAEVLSTLIQKEDDENLHKAIAALLPEQQTLVKKVFFEEKTITEIAKEENVGKSAIANRLTRIYIKLEKFLN